MRFFDFNGDGEVDALEMAIGFELIQEDEKRETNYDDDDDLGYDWDLDFDY